LAIDNGFSGLMAPTEILANQHFIGLSELASKSNISIKILTGSTKTAARRVHTRIRKRKFANSYWHTCIIRR
jgi:ATP-dependent DNA helicase RecG